MSYHSQYAKKPCIYHKQPIFFLPNIPYHCGCNKRCNKTVPFDMVWGHLNLGVGVMGLGGGMVAHKVWRVILATPLVSPQISQKIIPMLQFSPFLSPMSLAVPSLLSLAIAASKSSWALALSLFSLSFLLCVHSSSSCAREAWEVYFQPNSCYKIFSWKWVLLCNKVVKKNDW